MVNVGMRKDDVIDRVWIDTKFTVHGIGFEAFALEHATIEQDFFACCRCDEMFAACNFAGGAEELDFHNAVLRTCQTYGIMGNSQRKGCLNEQGDLTFLINLKT